MGWIALDSRQKLCRNGRDARPWENVGFLAPNTVDTPGRTIHVDPAISYYQKYDFESDHYHLKPASRELAPQPGQMVRYPHWHMNLFDRWYSEICLTRQDMVTQRDPDWPWGIWHIQDNQFCWVVYWTTGNKFLRKRRGACCYRGVFRAVWESLSQ